MITFMGFLNFSEAPISIKIYQKGVNKSVNRFLIVNSVDRMAKARNHS